MQYQNQLIPGKLFVPLLGQLIPRGDGTFIVRPRVFDSDLDTWITINEAARIGTVKPRALYKYLGLFLVYRRPLPRKFLVSLRSFMAFKQATQDADFWDNPALQQRCSDQVKKTMAALAEEANGAEHQP
jgi:hypothetical protein